MSIKIMILAAIVLVAGAGAGIGQVNSTKPNGPANKTKIPNKAPSKFQPPKSDLSAGVSVYVNGDQIVMDVLVANNGPGSTYEGQRTVTFIVKNQGTTYTFFKDQKIPALKGSAMTAGQQGGSSFSLSHSVPVSWGFDDNTVYEVRISYASSDPQPKNDVAVQTGLNKGKP